MKMKKGFTLTEILVVIAIIGIILLVAIPSILSISKSIKIRELESKKEALVSAAEVYAKNNESLFGDNTVIIVPVRTLVYYGYATAEEKQYRNSECNETIGCVINPIDNRSMNDELITIKRKKSITIATWGEEEINGYVAIFDGNGATLDFTRASCNASGGTCTVTTPSIHRNGYNILGFSGAGKDANDAEIGANKQMALSDSSKTYWAVTRKDLAITFHGNGGNISGSTVSTCTLYNTDVSCSVTGPSCSRNNYSFKNWNSLADGTGSTVDLSQVSNALDVYAQWNAKVYPVTLNKKDGIGGTNRIYEKYNTGWYSTSATTTSITSITKPTKEGYVFGGYYKEETSVTQIIDASGTILSGKTTAFTSSGTLYAKWTPGIFKVTLDKDGGTGGTNEVYEKYDTGWYSNSNATTSITSITKPSRDGYTFGGYFKDRNGEDEQVINKAGKIIASNSEFTGEITLYAYWIKNPTIETYLVDLDKQGGTGGTNELYLKYGTGWYCDSSATTRIYSITPPTKKGYTFGGYYTDENCMETQIINSSGTIQNGYLSSFNADVTLYAKWTVNQYTIAYNKNASDATGTTSSSTHTYGVSKTLTKNGYIRNGYTFTGWNTKADGSGTNYKDEKSVKNLSSTNGATVTLYAQWEINKLSIIYNGNGQTSFSSSSSSHNFTIDSNGNVLDNGSIYVQEINYNSKVSSTDGLFNYASGVFIFKKTGYHGLETKEWYARNINNNAVKTFDQADTTLTSNKIASDIGCDLSTQNCEVTLYVNWAVNKLYIQYNGNGGTWIVTNNNKDTYTVNSQGTVILKSTSAVYEQVVEYGKSLNSNGFVNYNGTNFNWEKEGYLPPSGEEYYMKTDPNKTLLSESKSYSSIYLAKHLKNLSNSNKCDFSSSNCTIMLMVNWQKYNPIYKITFNKNHGSGGTDEIYLKYGVGWYSDFNATTSISSIKVPARNGYKFQGYYYVTNNNSSLIINANGVIADNKTTAFTSDTVLEAVWTENTSIYPWNNGCSCTGVAGTGCGGGTYNSDGFLCYNGTCCQ